MDYQSVVVYTLIAIPPPERDHMRGCLGIFKRKLQKAILAHSAMNQRIMDVDEKEHLAWNFQSRGLLENSISMYQQAIMSKENFSERMCSMINLATAYLQIGQNNQAGEIYRKILILMREKDVDSNMNGYIVCLNNLGNLELERGDVAAAYRCYQRATKINQDYLPPYINMANIEHQRGNLQTCRQLYDYIFSKNCYQMDALNNYGNFLVQMQNLKEAIQCYKIALTVNANFPEARMNLGSAYKAIGYYNEAIKHYTRALELKPDMIDAFCAKDLCAKKICNWTVSNVQNESRVIQIIREQLQLQKEMVSMDPFYAMLYSYFDPEERVEIAHRQSVKVIKKIHLIYDGWPNLGYNFKNFHVSKSSGILTIGYVSSDFGNHPTAHLMQSIPALHDRNKFKIICYALTRDDGSVFRKNIRDGCDKFVDLTDLNCIECANKIYADNVNILVNMNGYTRLNRNEIFALKPAPVQVMWLGYPGTSGAYYMDYMIGDKTSSPPHDKKNSVETMAYMPKTYFIGDHKKMFPHLLNKIIVITDEAMWDDNDKGNNLKDTNYVLNSCKLPENTPEFVKFWDKTVRMEEECIGQIRSSSAEFAVAYVHSNFLDECVIQNDGKYRNLKLRGSGSHEVIKIYNGIEIATTNRIKNGEDVPPGIILTTRQHYNLPVDVTVYCYFGQLYKISATAFAAWIKIIRNVPESVLWLLRFPQEGEVNLRRYWQEAGLENNRLIFSDVCGKEEHVRRGQLVDVGLDTFLCNGHTTNMDILFVGTPVVTLLGDTLPSRVAASHLEALGLPELIATTTEEYENIAIRLGTNRAYLKIIRMLLMKAKKYSDLYNCERFTRHLEDLYGKMWENFDTNKGEIIKEPIMV